MENSKRVLMAMSGGVDSSVAAILLHEQGYQVIGITLKTWDYESAGCTTLESSCCNIDSINDARNLAVKLGIPHYVFDVRKEFEDHIISNFVDEYLNGRTPNPCVLCNKFIKWELLLNRAQQLGCDYIATGHYVQLRNENSRFIISKGTDELKDQSYMLWALPQESLARSIFPLGAYQKDEIKQLAEKNGFKKIANKRESYEICFIPDNDYRSFLINRKPEIEAELAGGNFVSSDGSILGKHQGYPFYTIGQRKGLNIALGEPMYVNAINPITNTVAIGKKEQLLTNELVIKDYNMVKYDTIPEELIFTVKIRYHDKGTACKIKQTKDSLIVSFVEPVSAVTPGQSAVVYEENDLVAGGFIA